MSHPPPEVDLIRLQKVMAAAGVGSRRACEALIGAGRVAVDGDVVREQGRRVDPSVAVVHVDGMRINLRSDLVHLAFNKPQGVLSTMSDSRGRPSLADYVGDRPQRLFHVGRLDADSEGLLFLTNDGPLAHRLTHPSFEVAKTYLAEVSGPVRGDVGRRLRAGVVLEDGPVTVASFRVVSGAANRVMVELVVHEGRNHLVRRLLAEVGHPVSRLVRTAIGPIRLGSLRAGSLRRLSPVETGQLYSSAGL
ncbi:MAG: pseudouridine synthase [Pseudonocardiales bacterium]|nr:MAG: pseudouridine synthase [Pseudonocardiales bacterium]